MNFWLIAALWMGLALAAALGSVQLGISVALVEILLGFLAGNTFHLSTTPWIALLSSTRIGLEEGKSPGLRGYGPLPEDVERALDSKLDRLLFLLEVTAGVVESE